MATGLPFEDPQKAVEEGKAPSLVFSSTKTISYLAKECVRRYDKLSTILIDTTPEKAIANGFVHDDVLDKIQDARPRFKAWATNIAALQDGHLKSSLDFRLQEAKEVRSRVMKILESLNESLDVAELIVSGMRENETWELGAMSDSSFNSDFELETSAEKSDAGSTDEKIMTSELDELLSAIKMANSSLMDISIVIRNTPTRDDYVKAAARYSMDSRWDIRHVEDKFGSTNPRNKWLIDRLGKSITRRRQFLMYRKGHHDKLSKDWDKPAKEVITVEEEAGVKAPQTLALTKATTYVEAVPAPPKDGSEVGSFETETSYQQTVAGETEEHLLKVPPPPIQAFEGVPFEFGHPFQCPYCWTEQNVKGRNAWKKHVFRDLRPYVCTFKECNLRMFRSRNEWFSHELQVHRREWTCATCSELFTTKGDFKTHLLSHRPSLIGSELEAVILLAEEPMDRFSASACSFCDEWKDQISNTDRNERLAYLNSGKAVAPYGTKNQFRRHLGRHMEQLALFALPRDHSNELEDDSEKGVRDAMGIDDSDASSGSTAFKDYRAENEITRAPVEDDELVEEIHRLQRERPELRIGQIKIGASTARKEDSSITAMIDGPWGLNGASTVLLVEISFPPGYPDSIPPLFMFFEADIEHPLARESIKVLNQNLSKLSETFADHKQSCLDAAFSYLLGEVDISDGHIVPIAIREVDPSDLTISPAPGRHPAVSRADGYDTEPNTLVDENTDFQERLPQTDMTIDLNEKNASATLQEVVNRIEKTAEGSAAYNSWQVSALECCTCGAYIHPGPRNIPCTRCGHAACANCIMFHSEAGVNEPTARPALEQLECGTIIESFDNVLKPFMEPTEEGKSDMSDLRANEDERLKSPEDHPQPDEDEDISALTDSQDDSEYDSTDGESNALPSKHSDNPDSTVQVIRVDGIFDAASAIDLQTHFQPCGTITVVNVYSPEGYGIVKFAQPADALRAIEDKDGSILSGSVIRVKPGQLTSTHWSVSERADFPSLLARFGSDWHGIAKYMVSKTHIMVKDYYMREVQENGKQEWVDIVNHARERRENGLLPPPLPHQRRVPKRQPEMLILGNTSSSVDQSAVGRSKAAPEDIILGRPRNSFKSSGVEDKMAHAKRPESSVQSSDASPVFGPAEEPYTIKCICDYLDDDGYTIYCETCDTWQHIECFYPGQVDEASAEEFDHSCADCKPRPLALDRQHATERQRTQRQVKVINDSPEKDASPACDKVTGRIEKSRSPGNEALDPVANVPRNDEASVQNLNIEPPKDNDRDPRKLHAQGHNSGSDVVIEDEGGLTIEGGFPRTVMPISFEIEGPLNASSNMMVNQPQLLQDNEAEVNPQQGKDETEARETEDEIRWTTKISEDKMSWERELRQAEADAALRFQVLLEEVATSSAEAIVDQVTNYRNNRAAISPYLIQYADLHSQALKAGKDVAIRDTWGARLNDARKEISHEYKTSQEAFLTIQKHNLNIEKTRTELQEYRTQKENPEQEEEYQKRLQEDLRKSGMDETQVAAVLEKDDPKRLSYTRLSRRDISVETLNRYKIDHELHQDFDSILIKRWVPEYEQDFLRSHTKEIREHRQQGGPGSGEVDQVAKSSGYEPTEEEIERQNLDSFEHGPPEHGKLEGEKSKLERVLAPHQKTEGPGFDRYVEKRAQELSEHFKSSQGSYEESSSDLQRGSPQATQDPQYDTQESPTDKGIESDAHRELPNALSETTTPYKGQGHVRSGTELSMLSREETVEPSSFGELYAKMRSPDYVASNPKLESEAGNVINIATEEQEKSDIDKEVEISSWRARMKTIHRRCTAVLRIEVQELRFVYQTKARTPGLSRTQISITKEHEWKDRAETELAKAKRQLDRYYNFALESGSASEATTSEREDLEETLVTVADVWRRDMVVVLRDFLAEYIVLGRRQDTDSGPQDVSRETKELEDAIAEERLDFAIEARSRGHLVSPQIEEFKPLEVEDAASKASDLAMSDLLKGKEEAGQTNTSKGKAPAASDEPSATEPPKRQLTDPSTSYPPCNTLSVGRLPLDASEDELKELFGKQRGYKRLAFRTKQNGPACIIEFDDIATATKALYSLQGHPLRSSDERGVRLGFSRNPLGVRSGTPTVVGGKSQPRRESWQQETGGDTGAVQSDIPAKPTLGPVINAMFNNGNEGTMKSAAK
ncbi:hypothetical protein ONS95_006352 [Cadophora gregata]|uniref:uncharacterized protein n=1 Tax=Cadophora gregata TaxID=51156 RepID=UPI0026DBFB94|nr:uncharacterized protein ONS95_006352 [Cadophora gregata]KAK0102755.1 hypothetical protein ONS95_006352 [Cadophora gregata]